MICRHILILLLSVWATTHALAFAAGSEADTSGAPAPGLSVRGDFNGDGNQELAWLQPPQLDEDQVECLDSCIAYIRFSDPAIAPIRVAKCIGGQPVNPGDLNGDGAEEISLLPEWFSSCWRSYYVWTLKYQQWSYAIDPFPTHCDQWEDGVCPIEVDGSKPGYVLTRYSQLEGEEIILKERLVPLQ